MESNNTHNQSPVLHRDPVRGGIQILSWLFFHPSAWRSYIASIDKELHPDFCLLELNTKHWRNPDMQRLLLLAYSGLPLITALFSTLCYIVIRALLIKWIDLPIVSILDWFLISLSYSFFSTLIIGGVQSLAAGIGYAVTLGLLIGIPDRLGGIVWALILASGVPGNVLVNILGERQEVPLLRRLSVIGLSLLIVFVIIIGGFAIMAGTRIGSDGEFNNFIVTGMSGGLLLCIVYTLLATIRFHNWSKGMIIGGIVFLIGSLSYTSSIAFSNNNFWVRIIVGISGSLMFCGLFCLGYIGANRVGGIWAGAVAGGLACGIGWLPLYEHITSVSVPPLIIGFVNNYPIIIIIAVLMGIFSRYWAMPLLYLFVEMPWNTILFFLNRGKPEINLLRWNSAFWNEIQWMPLYGLDEHIVFIAEHNPEDAYQAINLLASQNQRRFAQSALLEITARKMEKLNDIFSIARASDEISEYKLSGAGNVLNGFQTISSNIRSALELRSALQRSVALAKSLNDLQKLSRGLILTKDAIEVRFSSVAESWQQIISAFVDKLSIESELTQEIDNPYIAGVPLLPAQNVYINREETSLRIQQQLLDRRRSPLFIYGQRRMGKTSLLLNLGLYLPSSVMPLFIDGETLSGTVDYVDLLYAFSKDIRKSAQLHHDIKIDILTREKLHDYPFTVFSDWLDDIEQQMKTEGCEMALLMIDELEAINEVLDRNGIDAKDLLHLFRHLIQHRTYFRILLTSSYPIETFQKWAGYLINVQAIKISYLKPEEAIHLIIRPIEDFALQYHPDAVQRILDLTRGHPYLVQSLCCELVLLKNDQDLIRRRKVDVEDVELAANQVLLSASMYFMGLANQIGKAGQAFLQTLAQTGRLTEQDISLPGQQNEIIQHLLQLDLIEINSGNYHFQVELMRRWFAQTRLV